MADDKNKGSLLPISTVAVILAALGVTMFVQPFKGNRPFIPEYRESYERVNARLWQDPFQAVLDSVKAGATLDSASQVDIERDARNGTAEKAFASRYLETDESTPKVTVLAVMVPGGPYFEDAENRMRYRYALLSGLNRVGFASVDAEHVEFIKIAPSDKRITLSNIIPFEWLEELKWETNALDREDRKLQKESVLVIWISDNLFERTPLSKFARLLGYIKKRDELRRIDAFKIIGPAISGTLQEMVREVYNDKSLTFDEGVDIYSAVATVDNARLLEDATGRQLPERSARELIKEKFREHKIRLIRTIGTDGALFDGLINELNLRGVNLRDERNHLLLIAEWDTYYGRSSKYLFNEALKAFLKKKGVPETEFDRHAKRVHFLSYLRGIDGSLPGEQEGKDKKDGGDAEVKNDPLSDVKKLEQPIGKSQYDYLRRLAEATYDLSRNLRARRNGEEFRAIGVMGSDFYDKYLVLQALRQRFPDVIFFATDLDGRFLHPDNIKWTRNLVVASNFDLSLRRDYVVDVQGEVPPFRDNYQTSVFLTVLQAFEDKWSYLDEGVRNRLGQLAKEEASGNGLQPLIFEIGRHKAVSLTDPGDTVHPQRQQAVVDVWFCLRVALGIALGLIVLFWTSGRVNHYMRRLYDAEGKYKVTAVGLVLFVAAFGYLILRVSNRADEEPFSLLEGISIWPAEILRFLAILLSALFLYLSWSSREANRKRIDERLFHVEEESGGPLQANGSEDKPSETRQGTKLRELWRDYVKRDLDRHRVLRVIAILIPYTLLCGVMISLDPPASPVRGRLSSGIDHAVSLVSSIFLVAVIFYIFDVTRCCRRFITNASDNIVALHQTYGDVRDQVNNELTLIRLIAMRTETVGKLIFYPFIVWFVVFISRFDYFDNWRTPSGLAVVISLGAVYAWSSAFLLRQSAERARASALGRLKDLLLANLADKDPSPSLTRHIEAVLDEVRSMRQGAFTPFTQHPLLQSLLVPFGGVGGIYLIDFLTKMNF